MSDERATVDDGGLELDEVDEVEEAEIEGAGADEGDAGDAAEGDADAEGEEEEVEAQPRRTGRAGRAERARTEARELRERLERTERELAEFRTTRQQPAADPVAAERAEREFIEQLAMLPPDQQVIAVRNRERGLFQNALAGVEVRMLDRVDRQAFDAAARTDPMRAKFSDRVEQALRSERAAGRNPDREAIFTYLVGQDVLRQRSERGGKQRKEASQRVRAQQTRPGGTRSDVARVRNPTDSIEAARERIRGQPLW